MGLPTRYAFAVGLSLLAMAGVSAPGLGAQQAAPAAPAAAPLDAELKAFATAFLEVGRARDEFEAQMAQPKNKTLELQAQLRQQLKERVAQVIQAAGLTSAAYHRIEYSITVDEARRSAFEQVLKALESAG